TRCNMLSIRRILVPTDFSDSARDALRYAAGLSAKFESEIVLMHVLQDLALVLPDAMPPTPVALPDMEGLAQAVRLELGEMVKSEKLDRRVSKTEVRVGSPVNEIEEFAKEIRADLIVMGTHGRTGLSHLFLGSVAERIVRHAPCPVLTVRHIAPV